MSDDFDAVFKAVPFLDTYSPQEQDVIRRWMRVGWDAALKTVPAETIATSTIITAALNTPTLRRLAAEKERDKQ